MVAYYTTNKSSDSTTTSTDNSTWYVIGENEFTASSSTTISFDEPEYVDVYITPVLEESIDRIERIKFETKIVRDWNNYQLFIQALQYKPKILKGYDIPTTYKCRNILKYNINYGRKGRK